MPQVSLQDFVHQIREGKALGSFPTDTVPALAARPDQSELIYAAKQRPKDKPLILMGAELADLLPYVQGDDSEVKQWQQVANQYWPGALTLVLPASDRLPAAMNPMQTGTLGIRVPNHPLARYLLARTGPLATTSVNRSGQPPLEAMPEIAAQFPEVVTLSESAIAALATDGVPVTTQASSIPSTVIRWHREGWELLRQGAIEVLPLGIEP